MRGLHRPRHSNSIPRVERSAPIASSDAVPAARLAWIAGAIGSATQPSRLAIGFLLAVLLWGPGLAWDAAVGPSIDPPGLLRERWDDLDHDESQRVLRRLAVQHVPEASFEGARLPAAELAAALERRADELGSDPQAERVHAAARTAAMYAPLGSFQALADAEAEACGVVVDGTLGLDVRAVASGFRTAVVDVPLACFARDTVFACAFGAWSLLLLAVGVGAIARMEAVQLAGRPLLTARAALTFAADRWTGMAIAWVGPVVIASVIGCACYAFGFLFRTGVGGWLGAALYVVPLAVGGIAGLALFVAALGAPTAPAAVACDGLDGLDASQRGAIYFLARPVLWIVTMLATLAVIALGLAILRIVGWAITAFPAALVDLGSGGAAPVHALTVVPGRWAVPIDGRSALVWAWVLVVGLALGGAAFSLVAGALARAYLLLREACDGQPVTSTWPFELPIDVSDPVQTA